MTTFKRFILSIAFLFVPVALSAQALLQEYSRPTYQRLQSIGVTSLRYSSISKTTVLSKPISLGKNPASRFGFAMEDVLKEMMSYSQGRKNTWVNAGYGGVHGIDGLLLKTNSRDHVTKVNVYEFKTQNAKLGKITANGPQMSKKWIMSSLKNSIAEKERSLSKLKNEIGKAKSKGESVKANKLKAEFSKLNKERNQLIESKGLVQQGLYDRYLARLKYSKGKIEVYMQKIEGETRLGKPKLDAEKIREDLSFSVLDKDNGSLSLAQRKFKTSFFKALKKELIKQGNSEVEADIFIQEVREKGINIKDSIPKDAIYDIEKRTARLQNRVKAGFALLAIGFELHALHQWQTGKMLTSEFVFNTVTNVASLGTLFVKAIGNSAVITTAIFCAIDIARNAWAWCSGRITIGNFAIESVSNTIGLIVATVVSKIVGTAIGTLSLNPIVGCIIGTVVFIATYSFTNWIIKFILKKAVDHYEAIKKPERFTIVCNDVRRVCNL